MTAIVTLYLPDRFRLLASLRRRYALNDASDDRAYLAPAIAPLSASVLHGQEDGAVRPLRNPQSEHVK